MFVMGKFKRALGPNGFGFSTTAEEVTQKINLVGKTILVTGANSGLGYETARILSNRGAHIIATARTIEKATTVRSSLGQDVTPIECDLSEPKSVIKATEDIKIKGYQFDAIICNAGIMALPRLEQKYGLELQFLTNHIGHFILVNELLESMTAFGRVVMVSSSAHKYSYKEGIQFENLSGNKGYKASRAYGQSKLANLLFANELSNRLSQTTRTANAIHPGVIRTNLLRHLNPALKFGALAVNRLLFKSVAQGAATQCYVAAHSDVRTLSGKYFFDCNIQSASTQGRDKDMATNLWAISEHISEQLTRSP